MRSLRNAEWIFLGIIGTIFLGGACALGYVISTWFEPGKIDAYDEINTIARILNFGIPTALIVLVVALFLSFGRIVRLKLVVLAFLAMASLTYCLVHWWNYMDEAHGPDISLTKDHLWWGKIRKN
ncbi:MAG: hypothetical protein KDN19_06630 [Verrucomicrobiae bacterium]|nr:hypothetical protein [Verrucomicrobiae bacterium]